MNTFYSIELDPSPGSPVHECITKAVEIAKLTSQDVHMTFNGRNLVITKDDTRQAVYDRYMEGRWDR